MTCSVVRISFGFNFAKKIPSFKAKLRSSVVVKPTKYAIITALHMLYP